MLIMALVCFTFELIGIIAVFRKSLSVLSVFGLVMCLATIISCFTGYGGLKLLIILLNMTMTSLSAVYIYLIMRWKILRCFPNKGSAKDSQEISDLKAEPSICLDLRQPKEYFSRFETNLFNCWIIIIVCLWIFRKKEMEAFRQRNSMSISVINDMSNNHHNNRKISQQS